MTGEPSVKLASRSTTVTVLPFCSKLSASMGSTLPSPSNMKRLSKQECIVTLSEPVPTMGSNESLPATEIIVNVSVSSMPPVAAPEPLPALPPEQPARPPTPSMARIAAEPPRNCLRETCGVLISIPSFLRRFGAAAYRGAITPRFTQVCQQVRGCASPAGSASLAAVRIERIGKTVAQEVEA